MCNRVHCSLSLSNNLHVKYATHNIIGWTKLLEAFWAYFETINICKNILNASFKEPEPTKKDRFRNTDGNREDFFNGFAVYSLVPGQPGGRQPHQDPVHERSRGNCQPGVPLHAGRIHHGRTENWLDFYANYLYHIEVKKIIFSRERWINVKRNPHSFCPLGPCSQSKYGRWALRKMA